jgi:peptidoglycan/LPS O-acetylase OafA/YrhL
LLGRVSFSAYLLHAAVLKVISDQPFLQNYFNTTGWLAIVAFALALVCIVAIILAGSWCTYRAIEAPMIDVGKALIRRRRLMVQRSMP